MSLIHPFGSGKSFMFACIAANQLPPSHRMKDWISTGSSNPLLFHRLQFIDAVDSFDGQTKYEFLLFILRVRYYILIAGI